jgi:hypothetical protein
MMDGLVEKMMNIIALRSLEIRGLEVILDEVAGEFGGEDPLKPSPREGLETAKANIMQVHRQLAAAHQVLELPEPTAEALQEMRQFVYQVRD